jgi:hypothetical protein
VAPSDLARRVSGSKGGTGFGELSTASTEAPTAGRLSPIYVRPPLPRHCLGHAAEVVPSPMRAMSSPEATMWIPERSPPGTMRSVGGGAIDGSLQAQPRPYHGRNSGCHPHLHRGLSLTARSRAVMKDGRSVMFYGVSRTLPCYRVMGGALPAHRRVLQLGCKRPGQSSDRRCAARP